MGHATGMALAGFVPVTIFPRWDFLLLAANQLVTHLDKVALQSAFRPKVIVRVGVGATRPLDSGLQHTSDHTAAFASMLRSVRVIDLRRAEDVRPGYRLALRCSEPALVVEHQNLYNP